jgi:hypothetical protein
MSSLMLIGAWAFFCLSNYSDIYFIYNCDASRLLICSIGTFSSGKSKVFILDGLLKRGFSFREPSFDLIKGFCYSCRNGEFWIEKYLCYQGSRILNYYGVY